MMPNLAKATHHRRWSIRCIESATAFLIFNRVSFTESAYSETRVNGCLIL